MLLVSNDGYLLGASDGGYLNDDSVPVATNQPPTANAEDVSGPQFNQSQANWLRALGYTGQINQALRNYYKDNS